MVSDVATAMAEVICALLIVGAAFYYLYQAIQLWRAWRFRHNNLSPDAFEEIEEWLHEQSESGG